MGTVASVNPGVTDLLQTLSNLNSKVLSSPAVTKALENAPPSDIVQLSAAANQLQSVDAIFGVSNSSNTNMSSSTLSALENSGAGSSGSSAADQNANAQAALQSELTQGLFGAGTSTSVSGTLFNALG
jgi:hypothetical protein